MKRRRTIYEGKAKILYEGPEPGTLIQYFKDDTTAFDAKKRAVLPPPSTPRSAPCWKARACSTIGFPNI